jgi:hypothetical protein
VPDHQYPAIHLPAKLDLGRYLVPFGNRHFPHIVTPANHGRPLAICGGCGSPHPDADFSPDIRVFPMANHYFSRKPHPGMDKPMLPVSMGRLVQVHKVHINT